MSEDAEKAVEETATDADPDAAEHDGEEEPPAIPDEDQADLPDDLAAAAEAEAGAGADPDTDADEDTDADTDGEESDESAATSAAGDTYGDLYAQTLVSVTNAAIEEHGKPGAEKTDLEAARQLNIPDHANRLVEELGIGQEMPPGQALMASSAVFVLMNVSAKTDLPSQMMGDLNL